MFFTLKKITHFTIQFSRSSLCGIFEESIMWVNLPYTVLVCAEQRWSVSGFFSVSVRISLNRRDSGMIFKMRRAYPIFYRVYPDPDCVQRRWYSRQFVRPSVRIVPRIAVHISIMFRFNDCSQSHAPFNRFSPLPVFTPEGSIGLTSVCLSIRTSVRAKVDSAIT